MIHYNLDSDSRSTTYGVLGIASAVIATIASILISSAPISAPITVAAPSSLAIFGFIFYVFDRHAWRWPWINTLVGIPVLDGYWEGTLIRHCQDGKTETREVKMTISQRWTAMSIVFTGQSSRSTASVISLTISDPKHVTIRWIYDAHSTSGELDKNRYGEGATRASLEVNQGKRTLHGMYYNTKLISGTVTLNEKPRG